MAAVAKNLPTWAAPPVMIQPLSSTSRVMKIGLSSASLNRMQLSTLAYWKIRARLLQVPGVANVPIWGEQLEQLQVQVHPEILAENGISLDEVMTITADSLDAGLLRFSGGSFIGTGGAIETRQPTAERPPQARDRLPGGPGQGAGRDGGGRIAAHAR